MPFNVDPKDVAPVRSQRFIDPNVPRTGFFDQIEAAASIDNLAYAAVEYAIDSPNRLREVDDTFDVSEHLSPAEMDNDSFHYVTSQAELDHMRKKVKREQDARRMVQEGPLNEFLATAIATMTDPTSYIPFFGQAGKTGTVLRVGTRVAARAAGENIVQELALDAMQEERTLNEMLMAGVFGGALGFGVGTLGAKITANAKSKMIKEAMDFAETEMGGGSVGAKVFSTLGDTSPAADTIAVGAKVLGPISRGLAKVGLAAPALEMAASRFASVRDFGHRMFDTGIMTQGEKAGRTFGDSAMDVRVRGQRDSMNNFIHQAYRRAYQVSKKEGTLGKMDQKEFSQELSKALRRGDVHENPQIEKLARALRRDVLDPYKKDLQELGFFVERKGGPLGAESYFPRVIDRSSLTGPKRLEFERSIGDHLKQEWIKGGRKGPDHFKDLSEKDLTEIFEDNARELLEKAAEQQSSRIGKLHITERGPLKGRTLDIPDEVLEPFLDNDALRVLSRYVNTVSVDANLRNAGFSDLSSPKELIENLRKEKDRMVDAMRDNARGKGRELTSKEKRKIEALDKEAKREVDIMQSLWDRMRGTDGFTDGDHWGKQALAGARTFTFMKSLGSVMVSSTPDPFRIIMTEGLARTSGLLIKDMMTGFKGVRLSAKMAQHFGNALDVMNSQRSARLLDAIDPHSADIAMTKGLGQASNFFSKLTGLPYWNTMWKAVTTFVVQNRILDVGEAVAKGKKVSARDMTRLAQSRLTPQDAADFYTAIASKHEKTNGSWAVHIDELDQADSVTVRKMRDAINRDVDNTIITPGGADAPIWTGTEWGKSVFQFKKFGAAATQRILIAGLQAGLGQRDMSVLVGATLMAGMGALSVRMKEVAAGRDPKERTAAEWVKEGVDRSGLLGLYFDLEGMAGAFSSGMTPSALLTGSEPSRYAGRNRLGRLLGPTAGTVEQLGEFTTNAAKHISNDGTLTQKDIHRGVRMTPFTNLFYLQRLMKMAEEGLADTFDLPENSK